MNKLFDRITARLKGWRTVVANVLLAVIPVLELTEWRTVLPREWLPYWGLAVALINIYLRTRTTSPVGKKL